MQIGYARSSTIDQEAGYQAQIKMLTAAGCDKIFAEKVSSVAQRAELEAALDCAHEGDALVVTKLDWLARSVLISSLSVPDSSRPSNRPCACSSVQPSSRSAISYRVSICCTPCSQLGARHKSRPSINRALPCGQCVESTTV